MKKKIRLIKNKLILQNCLVLGNTAVKLSLTQCIGLAKDDYGLFCNAVGQAILVCIGTRLTIRLIFLPQRQLNSLDLCYMGRLLDDAAGGPRGTILPLSQVGQGHGSVDLPPVCYVFALHLLCLHSSITTTDDCKHANKKRTKQSLGN